jgi:glycosyltransferase involved in cell wall biosynthesis
LRPLYLKWLYFRLRPEAKPPQWDRCWEFAEETAPGAVPVGPAADVLFLPMNDWHTRVQRPQQLARALAAKGHRCFYLNPNLGREFPYPVRFGERSKLCRLEERVWEIHVGLPSEPVFHHRLLRDSEQDRVAAQVLAVLSAFRTRQLILVSQFPLWNGICQTLQRHYGATLLYDCHDLLAGFTGISPEILAAENELFRQADIVVFSARSLLEKQIADLPWLGEKARIVRNGVDVSLFRMASGSGDAPKVAGYVGAIEEWFDCDAIDAAAAAHPHCEFVFLGRVEHNGALALQQQRPNVRFYGEIPYERIPAYLEEFDVALIPFRVNELTLATNPIKLYEYFSCGLPVVSTALPEVELFGDLVYTATTPVEFARQVGLALEEKSTRLRTTRREIATAESWSARATELLRLVAEQQ